MPSDRAAAKRAVRGFVCLAVAGLMSWSAFALSPFKFGIPSRFIGVMQTDVELVTRDITGSSYGAVTRYRPLFSEEVNTFTGERDGFSKAVLIDRVRDLKLNHFSQVAERCFILLPRKAGNGAFAKNTMLIPVRWNQIDQIATQRTSDLLPGWKRMPRDNKMSVRFSGHAPFVNDEDGSSVTIDIHFGAHYRLLSPDQLLFQQGGLLLYLGVGLVHRLELACRDSDIDASNDSRSNGAYRDRKLYAEISIITGFLITCGCWLFVYFRIDPERWLWQGAACLLLLIIAFLLIAEGVYALL